jgi:uncharacterized membrane protein
VNKIKKPFNLLDFMPRLDPLWSRQESVSHRREAIKSFKAKANASRKPAEKFADWMTSKFGTISFLLLNGILFTSWIIINTGKVSSIKTFDPYPFVMLTTIVSLEAIFLAITVLISQNREYKITELREEIEFQINTIAEGEITKVISLLAILLEKQGVDIDKDPELKEMLKPFNTAQMERKIEKELS